MAKVFLAFALLIIAIFWRIYGGLDSILFTYDQARDALAAQEILKGDLKLVGPPTDIPGVFHGPLYYYFLALLYGLNNDPRFAVLGVIFINLLSIVPLYLLAKDMFKSRLWAWVSVLFFAVSFEAVNYARWLSNPTLVVPAFSLYMLGLWKKNWILIAVGMGIAIQAQLFMLYLLPVTLIYFLLFKPEIRNRNFFIALGILTIFMATFVLAEIKFGFQGIHGLTGFFAEHSETIDLTQRFLNYFVSLEKVFLNNL